MWVRPPASVTVKRSSRCDGYECSGAVKMYADFTDYPPEIDRTIKALRANGVPVIAVFPGATPCEPIVFRGGYTADGVISALDKATRRSAGDAIAGAASSAPTRN